MESVLDGVKRFFDRLRRNYDSNISKPKGESEIGIAANAIEANDIKSSEVRQGSDANDTKNETGEKWGYDLYPERRGAKYEPSLSQMMLGIGGRESVDRLKCESNVCWCFQKSPIVKLMLSALKSSGCEVDVRRHISCEVCDSRVTGGYDSEFNQIVVCQNTAKSKGHVQGVLTHEFIHMFDYCRANMDFKNIQHLACTEIRAANLAHCSFMSAWTQGHASLFSVSKRHAHCVKAKAVASVLSVRRVTRKEAEDAVESVFERCYNDLEPIGRRIRRGSRDMEKAYTERYHYGYGD